MAAASLSRPGTKYGACADEFCGHPPCMMDRELAGKLCTECGKPLGYNRPFYQENNWRDVTHATCLENKIARERT